MSFAYWCVLAAAMLPYLTIGIAKGRTLKGSNAFGRYDNRNPRAPDTYRGFALRAHSAHQNGLEVFPIFAVAVLVASHADPHAAIPALDALAGLWLALRLGYIAVYLGDYASVRSLVWIAGMAVALAIFTIPAWHG